MIKRVEKQDIDALTALAALLWPHHDPVGLAAEYSGCLDNGDCALFIAWEAGEPAGFAHCQLRRDYVEGTRTSPVGYLEGIFVKREHRSKGLARELLSASEVWAQSRGCSEFASDCELENESSLAFHRHAGFAETNRIICFVKTL